ncbi:MAG: hypothetical protein QXF52_07265 [Thermoproteota archaeon]
MVNPELTRRLADSIECLRRMDFFRDYSNLSSEEILERIFNGEIDYEVDWFSEEAIEKDREKELEIRRKRGIKPHGVILKESLVEHEEYLTMASDFEVDLKVTFFDRKRIFVEDPETIIKKNASRFDEKAREDVQRSFQSKEREGRDN